MIRKIKFLLQKIFRGFSDDETWNLDDTISKFVLPRLKRFKEINNGYPHGMTWKQWNSKLNKMIKAFELIIEDNYMMPKSKCKKVDEGLDLFREHFRALWW